MEQRGAFEGLEVEGFRDFGGLELTAEDVSFEGVLIPVAA